MSDEVTVVANKLIKEDDVKKTLLADKGANAQLKSWNIVNFTNKGDNYASVATSVEVEYLDNGEQRQVTYVVKLNPHRDFGGFGDMTSILFEKESRFLTEVVPELNSILSSLGQEPLRMPKCFYANMEKNKEQIYLEDLRALGFKMFDRKKGMDQRHVPLVLKELGKLHSASYFLQEKEQADSLTLKYDFLAKDWLTFCGDSVKSMETILGFLDSNRQTGVGMLSKIGGYDKAIKWINSFDIKTLITEGMHSKKKCFEKIGHGDCWNNNILFRYDSEGNPIDVMLLDLQVCREASIAVDLNYFLFTSLTGDVRKPNLKEFLSTYYSSYKSVMEAGGKNMEFSEEELLEEFRDKHSLGGYFGMMVVPAIVIDANEVPDFQKHGQDPDFDMQKFMMDWKMQMMEMLDTNPLMKPRFLSIFDELIESGIIS